jgi:uncharacterized protein YndB with AHSA1/START domain
MMTADRIVKSVFLKASLTRVWRALTDSTEFGAWFGIRFDGPFEAGKPVSGVLEPTKVNPEIASQQEPYRGLRFEIVVDRIEPQRLFSYRWHPCAIEPDKDYSEEPMTLVEFVLEEVTGGVQLTVTESGFDRIPLGRRATAFESNEGGWAAVVTLIADYVHAG